MSSLYWTSPQNTSSNNGCLVTYPIITLRPRQDGRLFPDDIFKSIFFNENVQIIIKISLTFVPKVPINNIPALVQILAWRRPGGKPLSEPMMVSLLTHICVTRPQWVIATLTLSLRASGAVHLMGNLPPSWFDSTYRARPKSDTWNKSNYSLGPLPETLYIIYIPLDKKIKTGIYLSCQIYVMIGTRLVHCDKVTHWGINKMANI